jgi:hypothetical protein
MLSRLPGTGLRVHVDEDMVVDHQQLAPTLPLPKLPPLVLHRPPPPPFMPFLSRHSSFPS